MHIVGIVVSSVSVKKFKEPKITIWYIKKTLIEGQKGYGENTKLVKKQPNSSKLNFYGTSDFW